MPKNHYGCIKSKMKEFLQPAADTTAPRSSNSSTIISFLKRSLRCGRTLGSTCRSAKLTLIISKAMHVLCMWVSSKTGIFGYLWLKWVRIMRYAPAVSPTSTASLVVLWFLAIASSNNASSNVACNNNSRHVIVISTFSSAIFFSALYVIANLKSSIILEKIRYIEYTIFYSRWSSRSIVSAPYCKREVVDLKPRSQFYHVIKHGIFHSNYGISKMKSSLLIWLNWIGMAILETTQNEPNWNWNSCSCLIYFFTRIRVVFGLNFWHDCDTIHIVMN